MGHFTTEVAAKIEKITMIGATFATTVNVPELYHVIQLIPPLEL